jgi:preprotein translocase subunit SecG
MEILITVSSILFVILCVLMIIIILLQSDKSAGMGILGGSSQSTFGSSTADIITKITTVMVALFMLGSLGLAILQSYKERSIEKDLLNKDAQSSGVVEKTDKPAKEDGVKKNLTDKEKNK